MHKQQEESQKSAYGKHSNGSVKEQVQISKWFTKNINYWKYKEKKFI